MLEADEIEEVRRNGMCDEDDLKTAGSEKRKKWSSRYRQGRKILAQSTEGQPGGSLWQSSSSV